MADVARLAEVSTATVSYFLSGRTELVRRVGTDAQARIEEAVRTLGYVQNKTARHLRLQRTERICVLLPLLGIPYADKIAQDVEAVAHGRGYSAIVVTGQSFDIWKRVLSEVEAGLADATIGDADAFTPADLARLFAPFSKPRLVLHPNADPSGFSVINYDRLSALTLALDHLTGIGRRRIAYIQNRESTTNPRARLVEKYVSANPDLMLAGIEAGAWARTSAAAAVRRLMAGEVAPDAILVESDFSAVTVIEELHRMGMSVPDDVAVIGCGNAEEGFYCNPRLTTIGPTEMSFREAAGHVIDLIEGKAAEPHQRFIHPWTLIVRESA